FDVSEMEAAKEAAPDPFDPSTYRQAQSFAAAAGVKTFLTEMSVRSPEKSWWVRRHPDPTYVLDTWLIQLKDENETYLVATPPWPDIQPRKAADVQAKGFLPGREQGGKTFPVGRPPARQ